MPKLEGEDCKHALNPQKPKKVGNPNKKTRGKKEAYIDEGNQRMRVFKRAQNKKY